MKTYEIKTITTMKKEEYIERMLEIRRKVNLLCDDLGSTNDNAPEILEKVLNIALNGDLSDIKNGKIKTEKIINVINYRSKEYWEKYKPIYL